MFRSIFRTAVKILPIQTLLYPFGVVPRVKLKRFVRFGPPFKCHLTRPWQNIVRHGHSFLQVCFGCCPNHEQASHLQLIFSGRVLHGQAHERVIVQGAEAIQDSCAQLATPTHSDAGTEKTAAAVLATVAALSVDIIKNGTDMANVLIVNAVNAAGTTQSATKEEDAPPATAANVLGQSALVMSKDPC